MIEKYLPDATPEKKEEARQNLIRFWKAILAPSIRQIQEERDLKGLPFIDCAKFIHDRLDGVPNRDHLFNRERQAPRFQVQKLPYTSTKINGTKNHTRATIFPMTLSDFIARAQTIASLYRSDDKRTARMVQETLTRDLAGSTLPQDEDVLSLKIDLGHLVEEVGTVEINEIENAIQQLKIKSTLTP
jgi:hypothetical protein